MAGTSRYSISQEVPAPIPLSLTARPAYGTVVQQVPAAIPYNANRQVVAQDVPEATPYRYSVGQDVPVATPYNPATAPGVLVAPAVKQAAGSVVDQAAEALRSMYPNLNTARVRTNTAVQDNLNKGQYARAAGRAVLGAADQVGGFVNDTITAPAMALGGGIRSFLGGLVGSSGAKNDAGKPLPKAAAAKPTTPVAKALAKGAAADPVISTGDDIHKFISARLKAGVTNHDLQALAGIAAAVPAVTKSAQTNKDKIIGQAADVTDALFASEVAQAQKLGANSPEFVTAIQKATEKYRVNLATLGGVNPQGLSMQQMLGEQADQ